MTTDLHPAPRASGSHGSHILAWLAVAAVIAAVDQVTKARILASLAPGQVVPVTSYFDLVLAYNPGAAFSLLADAGGWQGSLFLAIGVAACTAIVWMLMTHSGRTRFSAALSLILGGALGNIVDRVHYGHVIDFLEFHWNWLRPVFPGGYYPAFNVADSAISVGAVLLVVDELLRMRHRG